MTDKKQLNFPRSKVRFFTHDKRYCYNYIAGLGHRNSVRLSHGWISQKQCKNAKSSWSAAKKTSDSGSVKLFQKFEKRHPERGKENLRFLTNKSPYLRNCARQG